MKNKRKYPDQSADDIAKNKLAKLSKVTKPEKPLVIEIKQKVSAVIESRKNANNIVDIIGHLDPTEPSFAITASLHGVKRIFTAALEKHDILEKDEDGKEDETAEGKYKTWITERYQETVKKLCLLFHHSKSSLSSLSVTTLMFLLKTQWYSRPKNDVKDGQDWTQADRQLLYSALLSLCSNKQKTGNIISAFNEYFSFVDVKFYCFKLLTKIISTCIKGDKINNIFLDNVITILETIGMENYADSEKHLTFLCRDLNTEVTNFNLEVTELKKYFGSCWLQVLKCRINMDQYKRVLILINDKVIPFIPKPFLLTDFLLSSYNVGGAISLLALSGVFTLITKYNLEFPQFYTKLYQLLTPEVLHVKYKARFFHLADIFLSSTHLPEYMIAAFIKRLARISLTAPSTTIPMVIRFIHNLIFRHPGLVKMIDNPDEDLTEDPFDNTQEDPAKSNAIGSSLWEIESLQSHIMPQVSTAAKELIEKGVREQELDISAVLETTWIDLFEKETKKKVFPNVPINWEQPDGLKFAKDDLLSQIFNI